jgi:uncharacterized protein (TIGR02145 family)
MKTLTLTIAGILLAAVISAQALPFKYQAVLRNEGGEIIQNQNVSLRFSILSGESAENEMYAEIFDLSTNDFGQININIGEGLSVFGDYDDVDWNNEFVWLKVELDENAGLNFTELGTSRLLAVPFANYAAKADYNKLDNLPQLFDGNYNSLTNIPETFNGDYNSLENLPELFSGNYNNLSNLPDLFDGEWNSLNGKPSFSVVATSGDYSDLSSKPNLNLFATKDMEGENIINLGTPVNNTDAVTKEYVDELEAKLDALENILILNGTILKDYDGNVYRTVVIGNQTWMADNLRTTHYADGTPVSIYYSANNNSANDESYGLLYDWATMMNGTETSSANPSGVLGICPSGWHIPSDAEWKTLETYLGMDASELNLTMSWRGTDQGTELKPGGSTGFDTDFAGCRYNFNNFAQFNIEATYWTSTQTNTTTALYRSFRTTQAGIYRNSLYKDYYVSVRCVKD